MPKKKPQPSLKIQVDEHLPTLFTDHLVVAGREDGLILLRFLSSLPEGQREQSRMMIPNENVKRMLDVLCHYMDYYPKKQGAKRKK
ncbi:MAG: hypothetical protein ABIJ00_02585 [Candidatus Eisenbacteria bacterium]